VEPTSIAQPATAVPGYTFKQATTTLVFLKLAIIFFLVGVALTGALGHYVPMLIDSGIARDTAISIISMVGLSLIIGRIIAGYLMDRFFAPYVAAAFFMGPVIGFALLSFGVSPTVGLIGALMIGAALGAEFDVIALFVSRYFGRKAFGKLYAVFFATFTIGGACGPLLMGISYDVNGSYSLGLMVGSVLMLLTVVGVLILGPYTNFEQTEPN
jgi:MFS family permease